MVDSFGDGTGTAVLAIGASHSADMDMDRVREKDVLVLWLSKRRVQELRDALDITLKAMEQEDE